MTSHSRSHLLVFNAGSSSLKFELFAQRPVWRSCLRGAVKDIGQTRSIFELDDERRGAGDGIDSHAEAAELVIDAVLQTASEPGQLTATCHRIVHGAEQFVSPTLITDAVRRELNALSELAPLHIPSSLAVVEAAVDRFGDVPAIAVFDTMFFSELPDHVRRYAVPQGWFENEGVQRFGFHGIAHEDMRNRLAALHAGGKCPERVVTLQLGHGCSITALKDGRPIDTSMGFTPLEGLIMATRSGDVDPGAILHMQARGHSWRTLVDELNRESGLRGLSGISGDVRELLALERAGHDGAKLALAAFCYRIHKYLGAYASVLGGIDALVFGGGIGENAPTVRSRICGGLAWLGLELDEALNAEYGGADTRISKPSSAIEAYVISVHEEAAIAKAALAYLDALDRASGHHSSGANQ